MDTPQNSRFREDMLKATRDYRKSEESAALVSLFDSLFEMIPGEGMPDISGLEIRLALCHPSTPFDGERLLRHPEELRLGLKVYKQELFLFKEQSSTAFSASDKRNDYRRIHENNAGRHSKKVLNAQRCVFDNESYSTVRFKGHATFRDIALMATKIMTDEWIGPFDIHYFYGQIFDKENCDFFRKNISVRKAGACRGPLKENNEAAEYIASKLIRRYHQFAGRLLLPVNEDYFPQRLPEGK